MKKKIYNKAYFLIFLTILSLGLVAFGNIAWLTTGFSLVFAFYVLKQIDQNSSAIRGKSIVIPCIIILSTLFLILTLIYGALLYIDWNYDDAAAMNASFQKPDRDAIASQEYSIYFSDGHPYETINLTEAEVEQYFSRKEDPPAEPKPLTMVRWQVKEENLTKICTMFFDEEDAIVEPFACVLTLNR